ncbi:tRNA (Uracil-O(2)-)-methyltransferase [Ophiocordyceps camponoti-floridani]|uniref:tRNA (uracil-O(2)-)-methyltransferase n=1 Tax=Ophiocordyceps camponoti-floridani TaxID=2030778 RepID=A0A8H4Q2Z1_9HYPO|nr:tRNA (Uracil-O(2)-)-methyltransferase [Ophiocordyceps camponoti-floridani]
MMTIHAKIIKTIFTNMMTTTHPPTPPSPTTPHARHAPHQNHNPKAHPPEPTPRRSPKPNLHLPPHPNNLPRRLRPARLLPSALPFYHPTVKAVAHLHDWDAISGHGTITVLVLPFPQNAEQELPVKVRRTAFHLLHLLYKHGQSSAAGYVKRVHHDRVVPQPRLQNRYAALKDKYARRLVNEWAESTDPIKHVFEDLAIAAFLIELWADMYPDDDNDQSTGDVPPRRFPGFVDIGCGNGLLVHLLNQEGYKGWGFDARSRKSWQTYRLTSPTLRLERCILLPTPSPDWNRPLPNPLPNPPPRRILPPRNIHHLQPRRPTDRLDTHPRRLNPPKRLHRHPLLQLRSRRQQFPRAAPPGRP